MVGVSFSCLCSELMFFFPHPPSFSAPPPIARRHAKETRVAALCRTRLIRLIRFTNVLHATRATRSRPTLALLAFARVR